MALFVGHHLTLYIIHKAFHVRELSKMVFYSRVPPMGLAGSALKECLVWEVSEKHASASHLWLLAHALKDKFILFLESCI